MHKSFEDYRKKHHKNIFQFPYHLRASGSELLEWPMVCKNSTKKFSSFIIDLRTPKQISDCRNNIKTLTFKTSNHIWNDRPNLLYQEKGKWTDFKG